MVGGASGCVVAARLAQSASKPSVLLLEAGSSNKDTKYLVPADRFSLAFKEQTLNWGYKTVPQTSLQGQQIDYSRGKGLGGSTAINFCCEYSSLPISALVTLKPKALKHVLGALAAGLIQRYVLDHSASWKPVNELC